MNGTNLSRYVVATINVSIALILILHTLDLEPTRKSRRKQKMEMKKTFLCESSNNWSYTWVAEKKLKARMAGQELVEQISNGGKCINQEDIYFPFFSTLNFYGNVFVKCEHWQEK